MFLSSPPLARTCRRLLWKVAHTRPCFAARTVWHAGYLQAAQAQELADAIETKHKRLQQQQQQQQTTTVDLQKAELEVLLAKYEKITGEPYELRQQDCINATTTSNSDLHEK